MIQYYLCTNFEKTKWTLTQIFSTETLNFEFIPKNLKGTRYVSNRL